MQVTCTTCGIRLRATEKHFRKRVPCPKCCTMVDIPDSETVVNIASESTAAPEPSLEQKLLTDKPINPFAFVPITDANRPRQRRKNRNNPTSNKPDRGWAILRAGLLLQGIALSIFVVAVAAMTAILIPVVITAVEQSLSPDSPAPAINPSQTIPFLDWVFDGCIFLLFVSHVLCCLAPAETGVGHIAGKNIIVDLLTPILGLGLMLIPSLSDAGVMLVIAGVIVIWRMVQQAIGCWFLVGCADFMKHQKLLNRAVLAHSLSVPVAFVTGLGLTMLFSKRAISGWLGWVMIISVVLLALAQCFILLLLISVSLQLAWIMPGLLNEAREE